MILFHSLHVTPKQDYLHSIHFYSFPFLHFKTSNQGYLIPFHSILFHSFSLIKFHFILFLSILLGFVWEFLREWNGIKFNRILFHSIPFHSLMNSQTKPKSPDLKEKNWQILLTLKIVTAPTIITEKFMHGFKHKPTKIQRIN